MRINIHDGSIFSIIETCCPQIGDCSVSATEYLEQVAVVALTRPLGSDFVGINGLWVDWTGRRMERTNVRGGGATTKGRSILNIATLR